MPKIEKMQVRPSITTVIRRGILQGTVLNLKKTETTQKTSISPCHLHFND